MTLKDIRDNMATFLPLSREAFFFAKIGTATKCACLYDRPQGAANGIKVGGMAYTGHTFRPLSMVIRGGTNAVEAEKWAREIHEAVRMRIVIINDTDGFLQTVYDAPIPLGTDEKGVYEYSIGMDFYYF